MKGEEKWINHQPYEEWRLRKAEYGEKVVTTARYPRYVHVLTEALGISGCQVVISQGGPKDSRNRLDDLDKHGA